VIGSPIDWQVTEGVISVKLSYSSELQRTTLTSGGQEVSLLPKDDPPLWVISRAFTKRPSSRN
jgi:hypothetical protein